MIVPRERPLSRLVADALIEADWLMQVEDPATKAAVREQIAAARRLVARLSAHASKPDFSAESAELDQCAARIEALTREWEAGAEYLAVRRIKRRIMFRNPVLDFDKVLLIEGSPPRGHESGHRNTYGGDLSRMENNRILVLDRLDPGANVREVVPGQVGAVMRMDLHFDATKLVYGMCPKGSMTCNLYRVPLGPDGVATGPARQLTNSPYHDMDPIYLPDGQHQDQTRRFPW